MSRKCEVLAVAGSAMLGAAPAWSEVLPTGGINIDDFVVSTWAVTYSTDPWTDQYTAEQVGARLTFDLPNQSGDTGWETEWLAFSDSVSVMEQDYCEHNFYVDIYGRHGMQFPIQQFAVGHIYGYLSCSS